MDINHAYICLLGRPWIYVAGAITSTLHREMKFVIKGKLIIVFGEKGMLISHLSSFRYVEADEGALETSFQALEIANSIFLEEKDEDAIVRLSFASLKGAKTMLEKWNYEG